MDLLSDDRALVFQLARHVNAGRDALKDERVIGYVRGEVNAVRAGSLKDVAATPLKVDICGLH